MTISTADKRLSDARSTLSVPRLGLAAGSPPQKLAPPPVEPRAGLLIYHFSTSYQATMAGRAYGRHGKPAVGRSEGAPSADRGLVLSDRTSQGKGLRPSSLRRWAPRPRSHDDTTHLCTCMGA